MPKPSENITWATDATFTADGDPWAGAANKLDPGAARRAEGAEPDTFPAEWYNYHNNAVGQHIEYIHDVLEGNDTATAGGGLSRTVYLDPSLFSLGPLLGSTTRQYTQSYVFTAGGAFFEELSIAEQLPAGAMLTSVDAWVKPFSAATITLEVIEREYNWGTPSLVINSFGNSVSSGTAEQVLTVSGLTVRLSREDKELIAQLTGTTSGDQIRAIRVTYEVENAGEAGGHVTDDTEGTYIVLHKTSEDAVRTRAPGASANLNRLIPDGAVITSCKALVRPGAARSGADRVSLRLRTQGKDFVTPAVGNTFLVAEVYDDTTANLQTISLSGLSETVVSDSGLYLVVEAGTGDVDPDSFYGVEVTFNDPGPRNF